MNVAIPLFGTRVSPRFDCAQAVLMVEATGGECRNRREIASADLAPHERINRLLELGIDTVVCGGIDRWSAESLQSAGVKIYAFITGEADDALNGLIDGSLADGNRNEPLFSDAPGCQGAGRRGRRQNRGGGQCPRGRQGPSGGRGRHRDET